MHLVKELDHIIVHQVLMLNKLKVEEWLWWDDKTNMILSICREHGSSMGLEYTSKTEVNMLIEDVKREVVHLATEVSKSVGM